MVIRPKRTPGEAVRPRIYRPDMATLQLKITLLGVSEPPVWRRVLVPASLRLDRFHAVVRAAMGWQDGHLHSFTAAGIDTRPRGPSSTAPETNARRR
jgi:hypothetical protein